MTRQIKYYSKRDLHLSANLDFNKSYFGLPEILTKNQKGAQNL